MFGFPKGGMLFSKLAAVDQEDCGLGWLADWLICLVSCLISSLAGCFWKRNVCIRKYISTKEKEF